MPSLHCNQRHRDLRFSPRRTTVSSTIVPIPCCSKMWAMSSKDSDYRHIPKLTEDGHQVRQVEPAVQRMHRGRAPEREPKIVDMAVDHVEFIGVVEHLRQLDDVRAEMVGPGRILTECSRDGRNQVWPSSLAVVLESPLPNAVTWCPRRTSSSLR